MIKATILVAGFGLDALPTKALMRAGAALLLAPDLATALEHLSGGAVAAVVVSDKISLADHEELLRRAKSRNIPVLVMDGKQADEDVRRRLSRALRG